MPITLNRPNTATLGTSTPICAATDIATGVANRPIGDNRRCSGGPIIVTPAVAPTDSQKPTERTSSGSAINRTTTAMASRRGGSRSLPRVKAIAANAAIIPARSTDGSARVNTTNQAIAAIVAASRIGGRARSSNGAMMANASATF